ncbi:hypothetical protein HGA88_05830 [Candidatus Roizmanbacteria bacterium]|nr:hypothetical protein [Candidatus Roizmanbacteria bacterium]
MKEAETDHLNNLWFFLIHEPNNPLIKKMKKNGILPPNFIDQTANTFLRQYHLITRGAGTHPTTPSIDSVPYQRIFNWRDRTIAGKLWFAQNLKTNEDPIIACIPFTFMIGESVKIYTKAGEDQVKTAVLQKVNPSPTKLKLMEDNKLLVGEYLMMSAAPHEIREVIIDLYPLFRRIPAMDIQSGYHYGQGIIVQRSIVSRCAEVTMP